MTISDLIAIIAILVPIFLTVGGFIIGALWGHHGELQKRVTYADCSQRRRECPCANKLKILEEKIEKEKQ